jgi:hypothetical protein
MLKTTKKVICMALIILLSFSFCIIANATQEEEDSRYTIVLQSTTDENKVYSATAYGDEEKYDTFYAFFDDITADTYNVLVYYLNVEAGNNSLCTSTQWTSEAKEGETDTIKVEYYCVIDEIDVTVTAIHNSSSDNTSSDVAPTSSEETSQKENSSNIGIWIAVIIIACVVIVAICYLIKRKK